MDNANIVRGKSLIFCVQRFENVHIYAYTSSIDISANILIYVMTQGTTCTGPWMFTLSGHTELTERSQAHRAVFPLPQRKMGSGQERYNLVLFGHIKAIEGNASSFSLRWNWLETGNQPQETAKKRPTSLV